MKTKQIMSFLFATSSGSSRFDQNCFILSQKEGRRAARTRLLLLGLSSFHTLKNDGVAVCYTMLLRSSCRRRPLLPPSLFHSGTVSYYDHGHAYFFGSTVSNVKASGSTAFPMSFSHQGNIMYPFFFLIVLSIVNNTEHQKGPWGYAAGVCT